MRLLLLIIACAVLSLGEYQGAYAQNANGRAREDRPFQRWLPPPEGRQRNIGDQMLLLEQLRSRMQLASQLAQASDKAAAENVAVPELTEEQLTQLDKAYQAWTEQSGSKQLPDLNSVPKEWVDAAVANPEQLKQAKRVIEQYARQRNIRVPESLANAGQTQGSSQSPERSEPKKAASAWPSRTELLDRLFPKKATPQPPESQAGSSDDTTSDGEQSPGQSSEPSAQQSSPPLKREPQNAARQQGRGPDIGTPEFGSDRTEIANPQTAAGESQDSDLPRSQARNADARDPDEQSSDEQVGDHSVDLDRSSKTKRRDGSDTAGAFESTPATNATGDSSGSSESSESSGAVQQSSDRRGGQSDAAQLTALKDLLKKVQAVQAARQSGSVQGKRPADNLRSGDPTRKPSAEQQASGRAVNGPAVSRSNRNPRTASSSANRFPPAANGSPPAHGVAQAPPKTGQRRTPGEPNPASQGTGKQPVTGKQPSNGKQPDGRDTPASRADLANGDAARRALAESGSKDDADSDWAPSSLDTAATGPRATERSGEEANRAEARRWATQPSAQRGSFPGGSLPADSFPQGSFAEGSFPQGTFGDEALAAAVNELEPAINSASRTFSLPNAPSELSSDAASGQSQSQLQASLKHDIEKMGWEKALRKIIETTFKEDASASKPSQATISNQAFTSSKPPERRHNINGTHSKWTTPRWLNDKARAARRSLPNALSDSRLASVFADVWKAIATAPPTEQIVATVPTPSSPQASPAGQWKWSGLFGPSRSQLQIVLLIVALVCVAIWIGKRRPAFLGLDRSFDTRWAKETLAEGIRTRADVIRAFHRFVAHTTEPVASWWTHRYVARRLIQSTPQLSAALVVLSSAYEQARYMPPEAELSAEQISRVRSALQECVAYGNSTAEASA